jgi:GxxExxY protein
MRDATAYSHSELTGRIIKCGMEAHSFLGPGLPEAAYHKALLKELAWDSLPFVSEREVAVLYKDGDVLDTFRPDVIVTGTVVVELKALSALTDEHVAQTLTYLKATNLQIGLLINFGEPSLKFRRLINRYYDPTKPANLSCLTQSISSIS